MEIYKEIILDVSTGQETKIEFTSDELKKFQANQKKLESKIAAEIAEAEAKAAARQSALEKLSALGLTEAEIQALTA
jgi:predicted amino acid racemase